MRTRAWSRGERVSDAIKILGVEAGADIEAAITAVETIDRNTRADSHGDWRRVLGGFLQDLEKVQHHIDGLRPRLPEGDREVIHPLYLEVAAWIARCKRNLNHPGIKHQQHHRHARDSSKQEAGLQAWLLLGKYGKPVDGRKGRRLSNGLARILYGNEDEDLRRYCRPPFIREAIGNLISPFDFRYSRFREAIPPLPSVGVEDER
jgi:hypothetical protein